MNTQPPTAVHDPLAADLLRGGQKSYLPYGIDADGTPGYPVESAGGLFADALNWSRLDYARSTAGASRLLTQPLIRNIVGASSPAIKPWVERDEQGLVIMASGERKRDADLKPEDILDALNPVNRNYLETQTTLTKEFLSSMKSFTQAESALNYQINLARAEQNTRGAGWSSWLLAGAGDLVSDPLNLVIPAVGKGVKMTAQGLIRAAGRSLSNEAYFMTRSLAKGENIFYTSMPLQAATLGVAADAAYQVSERAGAREMGVDTGPLSVGSMVLSGAAAGLFAQGIVSAVGWGKKISPAVQRAMTGLPVGLAPAGSGRNTSIVTNPLWQMEALSSLKSIEDISKIRFGRAADNLPWMRNPHWFDEVTEAGFKNQTAADWVEFLNNNPTIEEITAKVGDAATADHWFKLKLDSVNEKLAGYEDILISGRQLGKRQEADFLALQDEARGLMKALGEIPEPAAASTVAAPDPRVVVLKEELDGIASQMKSGTITEDEADTLVSLALAKSEKPVPTPLDLELSAIKAKVRDGIITPTEAQLLGNMAKVRAVRVPKIDTPATALHKIADLNTPGNDTAWSRAVVKLKSAESQMASAVDAVTGKPHSTDLVKSLKKDIRDAAAELVAVSDKIGYKELSDATDLIRRFYASTGGAMDVQSQVLAFSRLSRTLSELPDYGMISDGPLYRAIMTIPGVDVIARAGTGRHALEKLKSNERKLVMILASMVDEFGVPVAALVPDQNGSVSLNSHKTREASRALQEALPTYVLELEKRNPAQRLLLNQEIFHAQGKTGKSVSPEATKIAAEIQAYTLAQGKRGMKIGAYRDLEPGYVIYGLNATKLKPRISEFQEKLRAVWFTDFTATGGLHRGTAEKLGLITRAADGSGTWVVGDHLKVLRDASGNNYTDVPDKITDLPHAERVAVLADMQSPAGALSLEALEAIRHKAALADTAVKVVDGRVVTLSEHADSSRGRRIMQEFFLTAENIDDGLIHHDVGATIMHNARTSGLKVAEAEMSRDILGPGFTFEGGLAYLKHLAEAKGLGTPEADLLVGLSDVIASARSRVTGIHIDPDNPANRFSQGLAAGVGNLAKIGVAPGVPIRAITEAGGTFMEAAFGSSLPKAIIGLLTNLPKRNRRATLRSWSMGIEAAARHARSIMDETDFGSSFQVTGRDRALQPWKTALTAARGEEVTPGTRAFANNPVMRRIGAGVEGVAGGVRAISGEHFMTETSRAMAIGYTMDAFNQGSSMIPKFYSLMPKEGFDLSTSAGRKVFRAACKAAGGLDPERVKQWGQFRLLDRDMVFAMQRFKQLGGESVFTPENMMKAVYSETDPRVRAVLSEFQTRLESHVHREVDTLVTNPRPWDLPNAPGDRGALGRLIYQFMSFSSAFYGNRLLQASNQKATRSVFSLSVIMALETLQASIYSVIYGGESPETVIEAWRDNPGRSTRVALMRVPWFGPWNSSVNTIIDSIIGSDARGPGIGTGGAGLSVVGQMMRATQAFTSGRVSDEQRKLVNKYMPLWNLVPIQFLNRLSQNFEAFRTDLKRANQNR